MSCGYNIKSLTLHELPEIMDIGHRAYNISWSTSVMRDTIQAAHTKIWGIYDDKSCRFIGFAVLSVIIDEADLLMICIDPDYQRRGFGAKILSFIINKAKDLKLGNIFIEVRASNVPAISIFEKHGFNPIGLRADYYPDKIGVGREDAIIMGLSVVDIS